MKYLILQALVVDNPDSCFLSESTVEFAGPTTITQVIESKHAFAATIQVPPFTTCGLEGPSSRLSQYKADLLDVYMRAAVIALREQIQKALWPDEKLPEVES